MPLHLPDLPLPSRGPFGDELHLRVHDRAQNQVMLGVSGELDLVGAPRLERACAALEDQHGRVLLDLSGLTFIDCAGLRAVLAACAGSPSGSVRVARSAPALDRLIDLLDLRD